MTRSYSLALAGTDWNSLWDLIVASYSTSWDPTFSNIAFIPSNVCMLSMQVLAAAADLAFDTTEKVGTHLLANGVLNLQSTVNSINLKSIYFKGSGATLDITMVAI